MDKVESLTLGLPVKRKSVVNYRSEYNVDMWREFKKRWMVFGVLISVALAVLSPRIGAPGGVLRTEVVRWVALGAASFAGGRGTCVAGARGAVRARLCALAALHAHAAAPALAAVSALALRDLRLDRRILEGALVVRSGGPCGWLALALRRGRSPAAPLLAALNYLASLLALPLALKLFCGQASVAPVGGVLCTVAGTALPFALGCWRGRGARAPSPGSRRAAALLALLLLYIDCCALFREAEGALYVTDVLATLFMEVSSVGLSLAGSALYVRFGLLEAREGEALALAAVPKALPGWEAGGGCLAPGLARLPAVFLAPAQALLLAALFAPDDDDAA